MELIITRKSGEQFTVLYDEVDAHLIESGGWRFSIIAKPRTQYVRAACGRGASTYLHRLILADAAIVDHINGNGLDNRRINLRSCTRAQNSRNMRAPLLGSSRYKGVRQFAGKWRASIRLSGTRIHLGTFATEEEAALAYDAVAAEHYGDFAFLNFPRETGAIA